MKFNDYRLHLAGTVVTVLAVISITVMIEAEDRKENDLRNRHLSQFDTQVEICRQTLSAIQAGRGAESLYSVPSAVEMFVPKDPYYRDHFKTYHGQWLPPPQSSALLHVLIGEAFIVSNEHSFEVRFSAEWREVAKEEPIVTYAACQGSREGFFESVKLVPASWINWREIEFEVIDSSFFAKNFEENSLAKNR